MWKQAAAAGLVKQRLTMVSVTAPPNFFSGRWFTFVSSCLAPTEIAGYVDPRRYLFTGSKRKVAALAGNRNPKAVTY
jgi:hypothetical protein